MSYVTNNKQCNSAFHFCCPLATWKVHRLNTGTFGCRLIWIFDYCETLNLLLFVPNWMSATVHVDKNVSAQLRSRFERFAGRLFTNKHRTKRAHRRLWHRHRCMWALWAKWHHRIMMCLVYVWLFVYFYIVLRVFARLFMSILCAQCGGPIASNPLNNQPSDHG